MRKFILGTDWWTDCDDAVALRLLTRAVKAGDAMLLGVAINAAMEYSVASVDAFLAKEGLLGVPLGIDRAANDFGGEPPYQKRLAADAVRYTKNEDVGDAVSLYRRILSEATEKVEIIEIGFLQAFSALLESGADEYSDKSGIDLVREKVSRMWVMAGKWDKDGERENNFCRNDRSRRAGKLFCEKCPVPVVFLGWEVGYTVKTGSRLDKTDHLYQVLCDHGSQNGRWSWDPMLVQLALVGDAEAAGYRLVRGNARVDEEDGANYFEETENGRHAYVVKARLDDFYRDNIDALIQSK